MIDNSERLIQLLKWMDKLDNQQEVLSTEIKKLRKEIHELEVAESKKEPLEMLQPEVQILSEKQPEVTILEKTPVTVTDDQQLKSEKSASYTQSKADFTKPSGNKLEKFIGENLINKIGIVITVIGVAIGVKYSIDHELISPLGRVLLGYLMGFILLGIGIRLKNKYENYSAVLVSGSMAIMYFMTYAAFSFYQLMPQLMTFALMVVITIFTVLAAIKFNKQVIAHIGLVGAYAIPYLLGDDSSKVSVLFSYMTVINIGVLAVSFQKYWKPLFYSSFVLSWLIFLSWFQSGFQVVEHFETALLFAILFFLLFYVTFLAYKLRKHETFGNEDILLLFANSFLFYFFGYAILNSHDTGKLFLGTFTVCTAISHLVVSSFLYRQKQGDRNLFYLILGFFIVFMTIAIPVQLNGNWVTLLWSGEALLLFWIGRTKGSQVYEILAYPLILLAFLSLLHDWGKGYVLQINEPLARIIPIVNIYFLTSLLFAASMAFIYKIECMKQYPSTLQSRKDMLNLFSGVLPAILIFTVYFMFRLEIASYFQQLYLDSASVIKATGAETLRYQQSDFNMFKTIWIHIYSFLFLLIFSIVNVRKLKNQLLGLVNLGFIALAIVIFLIEGLYLLSELREIYLGKQHVQENFNSTLYIAIRYISLGFAGLVLHHSYHYTRQSFLKRDFRMDFDILLYVSVIWMASSELINWMDIADSTQSYKLGLSILWGVYSLMLISLGIWKKKKHLRIGAIILFGGTLIKLFFYDISHLDTISKTIVFVSLGILLLAISFLYNKYRHIISEEV